MGRWWRVDGVEYTVYTVYRITYIVSSIQYAVWYIEQNYIVYGVWHRVYRLPSAWGRGGGCLHCEAQLVLYNVGTNETYEPGL